MKADSRRFRMALTIGTLTGLLLVGGCSASSSSPMSGGGGAPAPAMTAPAAPKPEDGSGNAMDTDRKIARTASITVVVDDVSVAANGLEDLAASLQGMVTSESISLPSGGTWRGASGQLQLLVPSDQLDAALTGIAALGEVTDRQLQAVDVTDQVVDVDSRIATMRASIARLQDLMAQSGSVTEIAAVEQALTQRQADLESLLAQQKVLSQRVATATVSVSLQTPATATTTSPSFISALKDGWNSLVAAWRVFLVVLGTLLPWLVLAAIIVVPIVLLRRRHRKVRAAAAPMPAPLWQHIPVAQPVPVTQPAPVPAAGAAPVTQPATAPVAEPTPGGPKPAS